MKIKCLTKKETSQWLKSCGQIEDPHHSEVEPNFRLQFYAPEKYGRMQTFASYFVEMICAKGEVLFSVVDTDLFHADQQVIIKGMWKNFGEKRPFLKVPGCIGSDEDSQVLGGLFGLSAAFQWRSYLYGNKDQTCLYNWEGEICDVWTSSKRVRETVREMVNTWDFKWVKKGSKG